jgi:glutaredoxin
VSSARLTLFTRRGCILCSEVRELLRREQLGFDEVDVGPGGAESETLARAGVRAFPALFIGERYVGGFTHVVYLLTQGRLQSLVEAGE